MKMSREDLGRLAHRAACEAFSGAKPAGALDDWKSLLPQLREDYCRWADIMLRAVNEEQHGEVIRLIADEETRRRFSDTIERLTKDHFDKNRAQLEAAIRAHERERIALLADANDVYYSPAFAPRPAQRPFALLIREQS